MRAYVLLVGLWVVVLGYWFWSRRPTTADTVGLFHRELRVLRTATPQRVTPANRLDATRTVPGARLAVGAGLTPGPLAAAAASHKRMEMRRRRRDILCALSGCAVLTMLLAALTGSAGFIVLQLLFDLALAGYVALLFRTVASRGAYAAAGARYAAPRRSVLPSIAPEEVSRQRSVPRYDETDYFASAVLTGVEKPPLSARIARRAAVARSAGGAVGAAYPEGATITGVATTGAAVQAAQRPRHAAPPAPRRPDYDLTEYEDARTHRQASGNEGAYGDFDDYGALALAN